MKTAVVTGITGCIGRHVAEQLMLAGWCVQGLTRADNIASIRSLVADAVFHCAGVTSGELYRDNVQLTGNLLLSCMRGKVGRFIFTSTAATHGKDGERDAYAQSKWESEQMVKQSGLDTVILQPCVVIGRYDTRHYSQLFNWTGLVFPGAMEFCWAEDVALAHLLAYERGKSGESYVIAGQYAPWLDFFREVAECVGAKPTRATSLAYLYALAYAMKAWSWVTRKPPLLTPATVKLVTSGLPCPAAMREKTARDLGYEPTTTLRAMVRDCHRWLKEQKR